MKIEVGIDLNMSMTLEDIVSRSEMGEKDVNNGLGARIAEDSLSGTFMTSTVVLLLRRQRAE